MRRLCNLRANTAAPVLTGIAAFFLYAASSPPGVGWWDTAEYQTVVWIAGISHPTGFPLYVMTGWLFTHLLPVGNPAWRLTMMSALCGALASALLVRSLCAERTRADVSVVCGLLFAIGGVVWTHATRAGHESFVLLLNVLAITNALTWIREQEPRALVRTGLFAGAALATHPISLWYMPGLLVLALQGARGRPFPWKTFRDATLAALVPLLCYAYLPIRGAVVTARKLDPTLAIGLPPGQNFWDTDHPSTIEGFVHLVSGAGFHATSSLSGIITFSLYPRFASYLTHIVLTGYGIIPSLFAVLGIIVLFRRRSPLLGMAMLAFFPVAQAYVVIPIESDVSKFYLVALWIAAWFAGIGAQALCVRLPNVFSYAPTFAVLVAAGFIVHSEYAGYFAQRLDRNGEIVISSVLNHTEKNAIIGAGWSLVTPLAYARYAEDRLGARIPLPSLPQTRERLAAWSRTRPVYWMPFPENELTLPGAVLTPIPDTWPHLYRVRPSS